MKVLLIDDVKEMRAAIGRVLYRSGIEYVELANGKDVDKIIDNDEIDVVITDIIMPEYEGIQTIYELREKGYKLPIIAISARPEYLSIAKELGATFTLTKPFDNTELIQVLLEIAR